MGKIICRVVVGSRLHGTATPESDWDYRGIHTDSLRDVLSPFKRQKTTSWLEGNVDDVSYELREFCKLATKGNAGIWEVFWSDQVIETSGTFKFMRQNWEKFISTRNFIQASRGYASNQYKKALSYDDIGERGQLRTAKFITAFLRVMWQCEQFLLTGGFQCSLEDCDMFEMIKAIKGKSRDELDIPLCFAKMEEMDKRVMKAEQICQKKSPDLYNLEPDS